MFGAACEHPSSSTSDDGMTVRLCVTLVRSGWLGGSRMEAERRQVTVLFTDMVGFTTFSERAGEEAAFMLMQHLAKLMEDAVREQGGGVQGFTGDGVMAVSARLCGPVAPLWRSTNG
jgi:class 3 adenylate cyclase